jgi:hypothetical protein
LCLVLGDRSVGGAWLGRLPPLPDVRLAMLAEYLPLLWRAGCIDLRRLLPESRGYVKGFAQDFCGAQAREPLL